MDRPREDAPLATGGLAGSDEALLTPTRTRGGSNSRAFKVAGLTTLACLLLASQVFTAYLVFNQKGQINNLQKNSDNMRKQLLTRTNPVGPARMHMPMHSMPLLTVLAEDDGKPAKTPMTKVEDTAIVSVEKQVKDLLQNSQLPQFNETFLANMESLRQQMEESEWQSFESWMHHWLIFQMAQEKPPAAPTPQPAVLIQTKCQLEAASSTRKLGSYKPQCDEQGRYKPMQCWHSTGFCWCVDASGTPIEATAIRGKPDCPGAPRRVMPARQMALMRAYSENVDTVNKEN
ncbi:CD74 molecule, major histocompatibility complex, class II invariant chain a [Lampris incognitus]|uniref:CD74 molecule, major histocompatibility complex, class II invariant chain a n=1 Tax=Lampris incognitus TaxID=2546036 RepID=UPI0024B60263|nr:CD74 molecule, major histocompatibility complex, class II invariant chain a [Lampris incognitus]